MYRFCTTSVPTHSCFPGSRVLAWCGNKKMNKFRYSRDGGLVLRILRERIRSLRCAAAVRYSHSHQEPQGSRSSLLPTNQFLFLVNRNIRNRANSLNKKEKAFSNRYFFGTLCEFQRRLCTLLTRPLRCASAPGGDPRNPARNVRAEGFVFRAESLSQRGFLVGEDKQVRDEPCAQRVLENPNVAEQRRLAQNHRDHRDIHRIANVTIKPIHHQMPRRKGGCRRTQSLQRETRKGIEHYERPGSNE